MKKLNNFEDLSKYFPTEPVKDIENLYDEENCGINTHNKSEKSTNPLKIHNKTRLLPNVKNNQNIVENQRVTANFKEKEEKLDKNLNLQQKLTAASILSVFLDVQGPTKIRTKISNISPFKSNETLYVVDFNTYIENPKTIDKKLLNKKQKTLVLGKINPKTLNPKLGNKISKALNDGFYFTLNLNMNLDFHNLKTLVDEFNTVKGFTEIYTSDPEILNCESTLSRIFYFNEEPKRQINEVKNIRLKTTKSFKFILFYFALLKTKLDKKSVNFDPDSLSKIYENCSENLKNDIVKSSKFWIK